MSESNYEYYKMMELSFYKEAHESKQKARSYRAKRMKLEEARRKEAEAEKRRVADALRKKEKTALDEEIRSMLQPFAESLEKNGWVLKIGSMTHFGEYNPIPIFILEKGAKRISVNYRRTLDYSGFEWD